MPVNSFHGLQFHHVACLTESIEESLSIYGRTAGFTQVSPIFDIKSQQVKVCFVETAPGIYIEFVEPAGENASLRKIFKSKNPYYHIGYYTSDIEGAITSFLDAGGYLVNRFHSEAFENRQCAFLYTPDMQLIELIEN